MEALEKVGLSPVERFLTKYPSDLSGGQKQRAVIARAIILEPEVLVADEPVSMLDMSVRAKILQLMLDLKRDLGLTYVYITHDLASAKYFCDRIAIMYLGRVVEVGPTEEIFANPRHPYTKALLAAIPEPDPEPDGRRATCRAARSPTPPARRSAAPSTRGAPRPPPSAAGSRGTCGPCSRSTGPAVTRETYDRERELVGDLDALDEPRLLGDTRRQGRSARRPRAPRPDARPRTPTSRCGRASSAIDDDGDGVRVEFQPADDPALRRAGGVDVACVLYPERRSDAARRRSAGPGSARRARGAAGACRPTPGRWPGGRTSRTAGTGSAASRRSRSRARMACQMASTLRSVASRSRSSGT